MYLFKIIANYFDRRARPLARRALITLRPFLVAMRARKPDNFKIEYRDLFDNVRFVILKTKIQIYNIDERKSS